MYIIIVIRFTWINKHYLLLWGTLSISWTLQHLLYLLRAVTSWTLDPHYFLPLPPSISPLTPPGPPASRICLPPGPSASRMRPSISYHLIYHQTNPRHFPVAILVLHPSNMITISDPGNGPNIITISDQGMDPHIPLIPHNLSSSSFHLIPLMVTIRGIYGTSHSDNKRNIWSLSWCDKRNIWRRFKKPQNNNLIGGIE